MAGWVYTGYPGGSQQVFAGDDFPYKQAPCKMVLHSTETDGYPAYPRNKAPHVTAHPKARTWRQHRRLDKPSWALAVGPVSTNSMGAIQIEIIGRAATLKDLDQASLEWLGGLIRFLMREAGVPIQSSVSFGGPETYGVNGPKRLSNAVWTGYRGILGHQHVPGNSHWDPGNLDEGVPFSQSRWFKAIAGIPEPEPIPEPLPEPKDDEMLLIRSDVNGSYALLSGGFFRPIGSMAEVDAWLAAGVPQAKAVTEQQYATLSTASVSGATVPVEVDEAEIAKAVIEALSGSPATLTDADVAKIVEEVKKVTYRTVAE